MRAEDIIIKPILTEKAYDGIATMRYTFKVAKNANKTEIKFAVEQLFGVKVEKVNTMLVYGKLKRMGKYEGRTSTYKKAVVQLKSSSKPIEFFNSLA